MHQLVPCQNSPEIAYGFWYSLQFLYKLNYLLCWVATTGKSGKFQLRPHLGYVVRVFYMDLHWACAGNCGFYKTWKPTWDRTSGVLIFFYPNLLPVGTWKCVYQISCMLFSFMYSVMSVLLDIFTYIVVHVSAHNV